MLSFTFKKSIVRRQNQTYFKFNNKHLRLFISGTVLQVHKNEFENRVRFIFSRKDFQFLNSLNS